MPIATTISIPCTDGWQTVPCFRRPTAPHNSVDVKFPGVKSNRNLSVSNPAVSEVSHASFIVSEAAQTGSFPSFPQGTVFFSEGSLESHGVIFAR